MKKIAGLILAQGILFNAYANPKEVTNDQLTSIADFQFRLDKLEESGQTIKLEREKPAFIKFLKKVFISKQTLQLPKNCTTSDIRVGMDSFQVNCVFWVEANKTHQMTFFIGGMISEKLVEKFQSQNAGSQDFPFYAVKIKPKPSPNKYRDYIWFNTHREIYIDADIIDIEKVTGDEKVLYTPPEN